MSEMTQWQPRAEVAQAAPAAMRLVDWAQEADAAYHLAQRLTATDFCPQQFRGKPADGAAAMLAGIEVGLSPITSLGAFDVIQGRAAARAITLRALVQAKGHEIVMVESTASKCRMKGRRAGGSEWQEVLWTIDRAQQLGLTGKDQWKKQPQAMLVARATSELARLIASDAILGIGYSAEEVADGASVSLVSDAPAPAAGTRTLSRKPAPASEPEQSADAMDRITSAQQRKLQALAGDLELDRDVRLALCTRVLGREVETTSTLTKDEAKRVIDAFDAEVQALNAEYAPEPDQPQQEAPVAQRTLDAIRSNADRAGLVRESVMAQARRITGRDVEAITALTQSEADELLTHLASLPDLDAGAEKAKAAVRKAREEES